MTEPWLVNVRRALRTQLLTVAGLPSAADQQQWDGLVDFTPPADARPWFRETMLRQPGAPKLASKGTQARIRHTGGYQIALFYPPDTPGDVHDIEAMAAAIETAFPFGLDLTYGGQLVHCTGTGIGTVAPDYAQARNWLMCPVRISWYTDTFNPI